MWEGWGKACHHPKPQAAKEDESIKYDPKMKIMVSTILLATMWLGQLAAQSLSLAVPQTPATRLLLEGSAAEVSFDFRMEGAHIHYTLDGSDPSEGSAVYERPLHIGEACTVKARAFCPGFLPSDPLSVAVLPAASLKIDSIGLSPALPKYPGRGGATLCDGKLGDNNFRQDWVGFDVPKATIRCFLAGKKPVRQVSLGLMNQQGAWIFLPKTIEVFDEKGRLLKRVELAKAATEMPPSIETVTIDLPKGRYKSLTIELSALPALPEWHPGKGNTGWFFLDEVLLR